MRRLGYKQRMFLRIGKLGSRKFTLGRVEMGNKMEWERTFNLSEKKTNPD